MSTNDITRRQPSEALERPFTASQLNSEGLGYAKILSDTTGAIFSENVDKQLIIEICGIKANISSVEELYILNEIYVNGVYNFHTTQPSVVMDIGQNVGFASLFFASIQNVEQVYGYEPFKPTFDAATRNFNLNPSLYGKIMSYNFGLGATNEHLKAEYFPSLRGSVGVRPLSSIPWIDTSKHENWVETIKIHTVNDEFEKVFRWHKGSKIFLKIDCEGSEYEIIQSLSDSGNLSKVSLLMIEWHVKGPDAITRLLTACGFTIISLTPRSYAVGTVYAFK